MSRLFPTEIPGLGEVEPSVFYPRYSTLLRNGFILN
jgi:hypothetical protein